LTPDIDDAIDFEEDFGELWSLTTFLYLLQSLTCFLMWLKCTYFLRIYRSTGFFITMLRKMFGEMRTFALILLILLATFGCTFQILGVVPRGLFGFV
jgi:hypothetical protein